MTPLGANDTVAAGTLIACTIAGHCGLFNAAQGPSLDNFQTAFASVDADLVVTSVNYNPNGGPIVGTLTDIHITVGEARSVGLVRADINNALAALNSGFAGVFFGGCSGLDIHNDQIWLDDTVVAPGPPPNVSAAPGGISWQTTLGLAAIAVIGIAVVVLIHQGQEVTGV